uniref:Uncharacterized protein n=1 Tax=Arundo donax TaxID=35708 RepID=A0A0A9A7T7_ARUDO
MHTVMEDPAYKPHGMVMSSELPDMMNCSKIQPKEAI